MNKYQLIWILYFIVCFLFITLLKIMIEVYNIELCRGIECLY